MKILHVDDDPSFLKDAKQCLDTEGEFEVDTASSVNEALEKLEKTDYDAVVSDYQMPGKGGLEFLKELREKGNTVPFIVFTGKGREEIVIKALNLGADRYIDKHGDPETVYCELAHGIRATLRSKRAEDAKRRSEERYRSLLESISDSVYVLDREWRHVIVNEAAMFSPSLQDIRIVNDCHRLTVFADSLLRQLFYNLVDNSLKYGEKLSRIRVFYEEKKGLKILR